ncbi:MAG: 2TM domain-containing protein [Chloroflexota bacterium]
MTDSQYEEIRWKIEQRYKQRVGLIIHLAAFVIFNLMCWGMWLLLTPGGVTSVANGVSQTTPSGLGFPWPIFITGGWSVGIIAHFLTYYYRYGGGSNRREAAIQREIEQELARREEAGYVEKPKNDQRMRIAEDGELEPVPDDDISRAEKNKRGR